IHSSSLCDWTVHWRATVMPTFIHKLDRDYSSAECTFPMSTQEQSRLLSDQKLNKSAMHFAAIKYMIEWLSDRESWARAGP
ncbi:hypothetical protein WA026_014880, partial [Henosepilachna vigintioctopunctata]